MPLAEIDSVRPLLREPDDLTSSTVPVNTTRTPSPSQPSATMTGAAGSVNAYFLTYIDPPSVFDMAISVKSFVIFLLGGASIKNFTLALLIGITFGTYSSIFVASALIVDWWKWSRLSRNRG